MNEQQQQQKPPWRFSQAKVPSLGVFVELAPDSKNDYRSVLILFFIWWRFPPVIKVMANVENILNDDNVFGDIVDTPKEGIEQHKKRECLKSVIDRGKAHLLGSKWTQEKVDKASDEIINKTYAEYKQRGLNERVKKLQRR